MSRSLIHRAVHFAAVLLIVSFATVAMLDFLPGDPARAMLGETATPEQVAAVNADLGFDKPLPVRYFKWLGKALTGDLDRSLLTNEETTSVIMSRLPVTLELAALSLVVALVVGITCGVAAASRPNGWFDRVFRAGSSAVFAVPNFLLAILLADILAVRLGWLPVAGWTGFSESPGENLRCVAIPVLALATGEAMTFGRLLRSDMLSVLKQDYILSARARGLPRRYILWRHALRPSSFSLVTVAGASLARLIGGTLIIESLFALPGLGQLMVNAVFSKDYVVVQGVVVVVAFAYVLINLGIAVLYPMLDPRVGTRVH